MNLLMLTKFYPYGTGEAFIENEINIFAKYFEKVTIIACEVPSKENKIRHLPENVNAYRINAKNKIADVIEGNFKNIFSNKFEIVEERKYCNGLKRKAFLYYFEEKSQRILKEIIINQHINEIVSTPFVLYSYWMFTTARIGTLIAEKYKPVYMFTRCHGYDIYEYRNKINYLPYRRLFFERYDSIFTCSNNGMLYLKKKYNATNIELSFLGTMDYGMQTEKKNSVFHIVSCSRIVPLKRVERILEALFLFEKQKIRIEWTHIGGGKKLDKLKHKSEKLKFVQCHFMGNCSNLDVINIYKNSYFNLFINVSTTEGLPVSIMEAISFGIPVIATNVGGTSEIVKEDVTGCLLRKEFLDDDLVNAIKFFMSMSKERYWMLRSQCREFWKENFNATKNFENLCQYIIKKC